MTGVSGVLALLFLPGHVDGALSQLEITYDQEYGSETENLVSLSGTHEELTLPNLTKSNTVAGGYGSTSYSAEAEFGYLKTSSHSDFDATTGVGGATNGGASPKWIDDLTITSTLPIAATGTTGRIYFTYAFSVGAISSSSHSEALPSAAGAGWNMEITVGADGQIREGNYDQDAGTMVGDQIQNFITMEFDFLWGTEFTYATVLSAGTGSNVGSPYWAIADVTDLELELTGIGVKADDPMEGYVTVQVDDFSVSADSGTLYPLIPEPSVIVLLAGSLAAFMCMRHRR